MVKKNLLLLILSVTAHIGWAQTLAQHNWYFGSSANAIRFNRSTNVAEVVSNKATAFGNAGAATASDPGNGNLLFYSDGQRVYDAYHQLMPNTGGLTGNIAGNQPVAFSPIPGQPNKYYVFTNSANFTTGGTISRLVIDMTQFGNAAFPAPARGAGEGTVTAVPGLVNRSEGMIIVPHANNTDFWLITHQNASQSFAATLIDAATYTGTFNTVTTSGLGLPTSAAHLSHHAPSGKIAVAPQDANTDAVIINFNNTNGTFSFDRTIFNSAVASTGGQAIYDIEWSPSGDYLYLSVHGEAGIQANVLQYDYLNPTTTLAPILPTPVFRSFGLQVAPDSAIYHLHQPTAGGPFLAGRISQPDSVATATGYVPTPFGNVNFAGTQFPSFARPANITITASFTFTGTCQNAPTTFFPEVIPAADSVSWDFGDTNTSNGWSPVHTYENAGTFNVTLTAYYRGQQQQVTQAVTINPFPLEIQLVQDTTACRSEFPPPRGSSSPTQFSVRAQVQGGTPTSYTWSNGDLGDTLTPDSAGYYYVVVTDASGCSAYAGVNVREYGLQDQRFNKWYFGDKAGIDFNTNPPAALNESAMTAPEGCAIVCDRNGRQIFYTDGDKVYDRNHTEIATGIGGDPAASQSAIIIPVPDDETLYYIFTTEAINGTSQNQVYYSLFDLKQNSGLGAVVKQRVPLFARSTERLTANQQWLVVHEYGNNTFRTYRITAAGIGEPVYSSIGSDHAFTSAQNGEGYMKLGPRNNLAVALSTPGSSNLVELFELVDSTGVITNYRKIDLNEPNGQVYGVEFSPAGNKLYATVKGTPSPSKLFEYSIDSLQRPAFRQEIDVNAEAGAIQIAPNGQVYVALNNSNVLGTINPDEDTTRLSTFVPNGFTLAGGTSSRLGLPNFIQINSNASGGPGITVAGICTNDTTTISGTPRDQIDEYNWQVRQGSTVLATSQESSFPFRFTTAGDYVISLRLSNRCAPDTTLSRTVTIFDPPVRPGGALPLCTGAATLDANPANAPDLTYLWQTGATTETIVVDVQRSVNVTVTNTVTGCVSNGQFLVIDNRPQLNLGPDLTICEDSNTPSLNAQNPGSTYAWTINGAATSTAQVLGVDTSTPGVFAYAVRVTDPVTTCFAEDTKTYTIKTSPSFTLTGAPPTTCGAANGSLTLQINPTTPATGPYSYFLTGPSYNRQGIDVNAPLTVTEANNRLAGTYSAVVTDQISGCTVSNSVGLSDAVFTINPTASNCDPAVVTVTTSGPVVGTLIYQFTNSGTGAVTGPQTLNTATLPRGSYTVQVRDQNGGPGACTATNTLNINPTLPTVTINTSGFCTNATLNAMISSGTPTAYTWTGPGIVSGQGTATISVNASGTYQVAITVNSCPITQQIDVVYDNAITPDFTQSDACQDQVTLTATPSGTYTYRWYKGTTPGTFQPNLLGRQITLGSSENGALYRVDLFNTRNGCIYSSPQKPVEVIGPVTATLTSTPPCEDGNPFTLTATTNATGVTYQWRLNNAVIAGVTTATTDQTANGTYLVDISRGSCSASASLAVTKAPIPVGVLPNRVIICNDPENQDPNTNKVDLDPGAFASYVWLKNELPLNYTERVYTATSEGLYEVEMTNTFGCQAIDETEVLNQCIPKLVAPNAFRPGSAVAANKEFSVISFFITDDFEVFIYNRWGELVFQSNDRFFKWNGGFNNNASQLLPGGSYAYVIRYVSAFRPDLGKQEQRGGVALLR